MTKSPEATHSKRLLTRAAYVRDLRPELPAGTFDRAPSRVAFMPVHLAIITMAVLAIVRSWVPGFALPLLSLVIGASFAGLAFVAHEAMHGALVRSKRWQYVIGWVGFLPFVVSPRLWVAWHNGIHHGRTNMPDDPDRYPTLAEYHERRGARFSVDHFSLGGRRWRGVLSIILGFTGQSFDQLRTARARGYLSAQQHRRVIAETLVGVAVWATLAVLVGPISFIFVFVIPLLVGNAGVMAFILTNHNLSPHVDVNDPLANGLTVTVPRFFDWLTLGFGYHVEHHLFPAMSTRHAPAVRTLLQTRWPDRYQSMPLVEALRQLHNSGRVYKTDTTLHDPLTGGEFATLGAGSSYPTSSVAGVQARARREVRVDASSVSYDVR